MRAIRSGSEPSKGAEGAEASDECGKASFEVVTEAVALAILECAAVA